MARRNLMSLMRSAVDNGLTMRRVVVVAVVGACLAGCSSYSFDPMKMPTLVVQLQIDSVPQGATAQTSLGPACKTPCEIPLTDPKASFSVSYTLDQFLPVTVPVQVSYVPASFWSWGGATIDPNPVVVQLQPVPPPPPVRKMKPKKPAPPRTAAAPPPAAASPFPAPPQPPR
jgi:hypothetical protein